MLNVISFGFFFQISSVLKHFYEHDKKVLFMGRKHMSKWPRFKEIMMEYNTTVFLIADE